MPACVLTSPAVVALNMHYDHHRGLPANLDTSNLFDSTEVNPNRTTLTNTELGRTRRLNSAAFGQLNDILSPRIARITVGIKF